MDRTEFILKKDSYSYHMMNIIDYLIGNTDRHWGNWGFWVDNKTNKVLKLHPLMDYNKAFLSYDKISGARCQTADKPKSKQQAAEKAVRAVGLNQIKEVNPAWFADNAIKEMFFQRLNLLKSIEKTKHKTLPPMHNAREALFIFTHSFVFSTKAAFSFSGNKFLFAGIIPAGKRM